MDTEVDLDTTFQRIVRRAVEGITDAVRGCLWVHDRGGLECKAAIGYDEASLDAVRGWLDGRRDDGPGVRWSDAREVYGGAPVGAGRGGTVLVAGVYDDEVSPGYLNVEWTGEGSPSVEAQTLMTSLANLAGSALSRRRAAGEAAQAALEIRLREEVLDGIALATGMQDVTESVAHAIKLLFPHQRWSAVNISLLGEQEDTLHVHEISQRPTDSYWSNVRRGVQAAARDLGVDVELRMGLPTGEGSQAELVDEAIRRGFHGIAVAPSAPEATEPAIRRAREAGIPVVAFDSPPVEGSAALVYIGTDNVGAGALAGQALARIVPEGAEVGSLVGSRAVPNGEQRIAGFLGGATRAGLTTLACIEDQRTPHLGPQLIGELLAAHPGLGGAFGAWDDNGPTWAAALKKQGKAGHVKIVAFDLSADTTAMLQDGSIHVAVVQREAEMGYRSVRILAQMAADGVDGALAELGGSRVIDIGVDLVTLDRTAWSTDLAEHLTRKRWTTADPSVVARIAGAAQPIRIMVIGMAWPTRGNVLERGVALPARSLVSAICSSGEPAVVDPTSSEHADVDEVVQARMHRLRTVVGVPLRAEGAVRGVMFVGSEQPGACSPADLALLQRVASATTVAIDNAQLVRALRSRATELEAAFARQRALLDTIFELSCPVVPVAPGILVIPLVGALDEPRAEHLLETLLREASERSAAVVLVDVTGVTGLDAQLAARLSRATAAVRCLGVELVIVGIDPTAARRLAEGDGALRSIESRRDLESGFAYALSKRNLRLHFKRSRRPWVGRAS